MRPLYYYLDGHTPVPYEGPRSIEEAILTEKQIGAPVAKSLVGDDIAVSTVFLAIDHNFMGGPPLLFETMIFGGEYDGFQRRYATWEEAEAGHEAVVGLVALGLSLDEQPTTH